MNHNSIVFHSLVTVKKAYYKLSLLVHPDRVEEAKKAVANEKFKILGKIYSILQDEEQRKIYDENGDFDDDSYAIFNWVNFWRSQFKKISTKDIENYKCEYVGSDTEVQDIKKAYVNGKGSMDYILEAVPFSNVEDEPRILEIVQKLVDDKEVERLDRFFNEPEKKKTIRKRKHEREVREHNKMNISDDDLANAIMVQQEKRQEKMADLFLQLEEKYGGGGGAKRKRKAIANGKVEKKQTRRTKKR